ncbi:hypothetical protein [Bradyrhizobium sp. DOA1]|uniref:hypothetical protein n=1 Tax=Bradyrhizobium sp. DOA1 TaxID=1126616 RepID=UPI001FDA215A|nr:hypothetical protein [Bradyrhizobium sp. DOA1]
MNARLVGKLVTHLSAAPQSSTVEIYAPSLRSLPEGSLLVMATLPVVDWNDCLLQDLRILSKRTAHNVYAAMVMIDPFACWQDVAQFLKEAGINGLINFPPASLIERSSTGVPVDSGQELELRRLEWFAQLEFKILFAAGHRSEFAAAERRLGSHLDGIIHLPEEALKLSIGKEMKLVGLNDQEPSVPTFALLDGTSAMRKT